MCIIITPCGKYKYLRLISDVEQVLVRLCNSNLKVNTEKLTFGKTEIDYLGYIFSREGIKYQPRKIEVIMKISRPTNIKDARRFLGMVQYYRDMWQHRSHIMGPLTELISGSKTNKF